MRIAASLVLTILVLLIFGVFTGVFRGLSGPDRPTLLTLTDASHFSNPVVVQSLTINGRPYGFPPYLASNAWENPRGGNVVLTELSWPDSTQSEITFRSEWVEAYTNRFFQGEVTVLWNDIAVKDQVDWTAYITVLYGPDGEFSIFTDDGPDPVSGHYNGRLVARTCGVPNPTLDEDYRNNLQADVDLDWVYEQEHRALKESISSFCAGEK